MTAEQINRTPPGTPLYCATRLIRGRDAVTDEPLLNPFIYEGASLYRRRQQTPADPPSRFVIHNAATGYVEGIRYQDLDLWFTDPSDALAYGSELLRLQSREIAGLLPMNISPR